MEIKKEIIINVPTFRVYDAITDMKQLSKWFPDVISLEPKIDGKIIFKIFSSSSDTHDIIEGKIVELEKNKKLAYTWSHPNVPNFPITKVSWNLVKVDENKTKVVIIHSGFVDEDTMNSYNKRWLWITEHLETFAISEKPVSMKEQITSTLIPGMDMWAFYRIKKLRKWTLYIGSPGIIVSVVSFLITFSNYNNFQKGVLNSDKYFELQTITVIGIIIFIISIMYITNRLMRKWTKEWNQQFAETKKNRPMGLFILSILFALDAMGTAILLGFKAGFTELQSVAATQSTVYSDFIAQYALVHFSDWFFELGIFVIIVDALAVIGLLSAKTNGRKLAIGCGFTGIVFGMLTLNPASLVACGILVWYLFKVKTKESFRITT